jgi:GT2 family glycosyltransferase
VNPSITVVIVAFNSAEHLDSCLQALLPQAGAADEVIVVDNNSTDGATSNLEARFPGIRLIRHSRNLGFAGGNNVALRQARGDLVLLLNPDVIVEPLALTKVRDFMRANLDVAALGPRVLLPDGRVDPASHRSFKTPATYLYKATGLSRMFPGHPTFGHYYLSYRDDASTADVDSIVGAFFLIRRSIIDRIGILDERFFMYCEDEDWCWRVRQIGGRIVYLPDITVRHFKGGSTRQVRMRMIYHWHRSVLLYHRKNIAPSYSRLVNWSVYTGIVAAMLVRLATPPFRLRGRARSEVSA